MEWYILIFLSAIFIALRRLPGVFSTIIGGTYFKEKRVLQKTMISLIMVLGVFLVLT